MKGRPTTKRILRTIEWKKSGRLRPLRPGMLRRKADCSRGKVGFKSSKVRSEWAGYVCFRISSSAAEVKTIACSRSPDPFQ